jgi:hypothetical protein
MKPNRAFIEKGWILVSIGYGGVRAALVWTFLKKYGVNPYVFSLIEFSSAAIYGLSSARVVGAIVDANWDLLRTWVPIAVLSYAAPDVYVFASAGHLPGSMLEMLLGIVGVTAVITTVGLVVQVRKGRTTTNHPKTTHTDPSQIG